MSIEKYINKVHCMDCIKLMKELPDNCVNSIVTDPPYELGFMNKSWDKSGIAYNVDLWRECLRILKAGGHLLAFGGTRTYHRMACAIEDAGFEIRDQLQWLYGSGFPKSLNISKAIDKKFGAEREVVGKKTTGKAGSRADKRNNNEGFESGQMIVDITMPSTPKAKQWDGWGTALKPSHEPICMGRKPIAEKTVCDNVLKYGTGGINIDDCRINFKQNDDKRVFKDYKWNSKAEPFGDAIKMQYRNGWNKQGRFPSNIIFSHHPECKEICHPDCAVKILDEQSGISKSTGGSGEKSIKSASPFFTSNSTKKGNNLGGLGDIGTASRFFYCAKASKAERNNGCENLAEKAMCDINKMGGSKCSMKTGSGNDRNVLKNNHHPTVKPKKLMQYLIKLITPPNGIVIDPFAGSGSTLIACKSLGFNFIGIEKNTEYCKIAEARIAAEQAQLKLPLKE